MLKSVPTIAVISLTILVYILTKNPLTGPLKIQMALIAIIVLLVYKFLIAKDQPNLTKRFIYILFTSVLFLVGATGWFFSPFFFALYLAGIFLAFIFSPVVSAGFIITLVALFSFNIGEVDLVYDFLVVLSLLTVIPISLYLRKEYLKLKESEKDILVLKDEKDKYQNKVEEVLANKIVNLAVNLRQPINDTKQLAYRLEKVKLKSEVKKIRERIIVSAEEALRLIKSFEEQTTGKKLVSTLEKIEPSLKADQD